MSRANRHFPPNHVWHLTHRCHEKAFLLQEAHHNWVDQALTRGAARDDRWSQAIAVRSRAFVDKVKGDLGIKGKYREVAEAGGTHTLREPTAAYASDFGRESDTLTLDNTVLWEKSLRKMGSG